MFQYHYAGNKDSYRCLSIDDYLEDIGRKIYQEIYQKKSQVDWKMKIIISETFSKPNDGGTFKTDDLYIKSDSFTRTRDMSIKDLIKEIGESISRNHEEGIENHLVSSGLSHDCINRVYVKFIKINSPGGLSYIPTPEWLFNKKATVNPNNSKRGDNKCFHYALLIAIHHKELGKTPERVEKLTKCIDKYNKNWHGIKYPPDLHDFKRFENKNKNISLFLRLSTIQKTNKILPHRISG